VRSTCRTISTPCGAITIRSRKRGRHLCHGEREPGPRRVTCSWLSVPA
jgi:hypothetical protein